MSTRAYLIFWYNCSMTTENKPFHGAILLLNSHPDEETVKQIADAAAGIHFPTRTCSYELRETLPDNTPVDVVDQYTAAMRDLPEEAKYLVISPVEGNTTT